MSFGVCMRCLTMNSKFFRLLPAPQGVGLLDCAAQATERWTFPFICMVVVVVFVTVLLSLYISWNLGSKATNCYLWSLCSQWSFSSLALIWINTLFACTMQPSEVYFLLNKGSKKKKKKIPVFFFSLHSLVWGKYETTKKKTPHTNDQLKSK